ncbi:MAG: hypothetical protein KGL04_10025 [Elusimicrobia bacterium]|nr:hypothetical protein [Elusimicrobiota bacterium]
MRRSRGQDIIARPGRFASARRCQDSVTDRGFRSKESKRLKTGKGLAILCGLCLSFILAAARRGRAEIPVGLDAQGVSVSWAIRNPLGLDVRDALARPVSAGLVEEQLKSAQAHAEARAAYASRLPLARAFVRFLEFLPALKLFMAGGFPAPARRGPEAVRTAPKPEPKAGMPVPLVLGAVLGSAALRLESFWRPCRHDSPSLTPLRC